MRTSLLMLSIAVLASCKTTTAPAPEPAAKPETPEAWKAIEGEVTAAMNMEADPCADFYEYACGGWIENFELPADKASYYRSFNSIQENNQKVLKDLVTEISENPGDDQGRQQIASFYNSCMDTEAIDAKGVEPIKPMLDKAQSIKDLDALMAFASELQYQDVPVLLGIGVWADEKNPEINILSMAQGGLGLPDKSYYLDLDEKGQERLATYEAHIAKMLTLSGKSEDDAKKAAADVVAFETALASISWDRVEMRDSDKTYNKIDLEGLQGLTPNLKWDQFFGAIEGGDKLTQINVNTPSFFEKLDALLSGGDLEGSDYKVSWPAIQAYLEYSIVNAKASHLSTELDQADFDFYGKVLYGITEQQPRWKRCVTRTEGALGDLLGKAYVDSAFAGESKAIAHEMVVNIEKAFESNLPNLEWMDDETRARAVEKARAITNKIGYADQWRSYEGLEVSDDYFANHTNSAKFNSAWYLGKVGEKVDPLEWHMTPPTVNAYYNPTANEIVFPAGILQSPFFDKDHPQAMNYGAIGMVIGHEITHGFDDQGRKYAPDGKLSEWWAPEVAGKFEERAECVSNDYSSFEVKPGMNVNGELTLGENIADLGGLKQAYLAYNEWNKTAQEPTIAGLSNEQLFFVGFAQGWCGIAKDEYLQVQLATDPHSPAKARVNVPLKHFPGFAEAFECEAGTPMRPENTCEVW